MSESEIIHIKDSFDVVDARMQVRLLARSAGLDVLDQARIALATSTMAYILGLGKSQPGQIALMPCREGKRAGVRILCTCLAALRYDIPAGVVDDAARMVDELQIEHLPSGGIQVTLVKWGASEAR